MQGRPDAPKVIIVITDGKSTFTRDTRKQAHMAKADGMFLYNNYPGPGCSKLTTSLVNVSLIFQT